MNNLTLTNDQPTAHQTIGHMDGDTIIFTCPKCEYVRRLNWKTGKSTVKKGAENIPHVGSHAPMTTGTLPISEN